jgi:RimJ/RimL family protein N-acetyltransferase
MITVAPSERLTYRLMTADDAELLWELDQDPEVMKYITHGEISSREKIHTVFLPRMAQYHNPDKGWGLWGVFSQHDGDFLGWILVRPMGFFSQQPTDTNNLELGWRFKRCYWGAGFATEAATAVLETLRSERSASQFSAIAMPENEGSINIMKKLGMHFVDQRVIDDVLGPITAVYFTMS